MARVDLYVAGWKRPCQCCGNTTGEMSTMGALHGTTKTTHERESAFDYLPSLESTETW